MDEGWHRMFRRRGKDLLAKTKLPHYSLLCHFLNGDIEYDFRFCHPVRAISGAKTRYTAWVLTVYSILRVWLPDGLLAAQHVELLVECRIAIPHVILRKASLWKKRMS